MTTIQIDLSNVDWELLRKQKQTLLEARAVVPKSCPSVCVEDLTGLIHLLDHIQDRAAIILGEEAVFGENE